MVDDDGSVTELRLFFAFVNLNGEEKREREKSWKEIAFLVLTLLLLIKLLAVIKYRPM